MNNLHTYNTTRFIRSNIKDVEGAIEALNDSEIQVQFYARKKNNAYEVFAAVEEETTINHSFLISQKRVSTNSNAFYNAISPTRASKWGSRAFIEGFCVDEYDFKRLKEVGLGDVQVIETIEEIAVMTGSNVAYYYQNPQ